MRHVLATCGLLLTGAALAQTPLSPPTMPTQPQLAPQTPLAPAPQLPATTQAPLPPQPSGAPVTQPQLPAEKPLAQTPQLSPPAPLTTRRPLAQPALTMDGGTGPSSTVSFPAPPPGGAQPRRDGGTP